MSEHPIIGKKMIEALVNAGIVDNNTRRLIIDVPLDGIPVLYTEKYGTASLLEIVPVLAEHPNEIKRGEPISPDTSTHYPRAGERLDQLPTAAELDGLYPDSPAHPLA